MAQMRQGVQIIPPAPPPASLRQAIIGSRRFRAEHLGVNPGSQPLQTSSDRMWRPGGAVAGDGDGHRPLQTRSDCSGLREAQVVVVTGHPRNGTASYITLASQDPGG